MNCVVRRFDASSLKCGIRISSFFKRKKRNENTGTVTSNVATGNDSALKLAEPLTRMSNAAIKPDAAKNNVSAKNTYSTPNGLRTLTIGCDCVAVPNGELVAGAGASSGAEGGVDGVGIANVGVGGVGVGIGVTGEVKLDACGIGSAEGNVNGDGNTS